MGLFDFLKSVVSSNQKDKKEKRKLIYNQGDLLVFFAECEKCGELFRVIIRKHSELFKTYGNGPGVYEIKKELIGARCQNKINVHFTLKQNFKEISHEVDGGRLLTKEEYEELKNKEE